MHVYEVSMNTASDKYKTAYVRATSFSAAVAIVAAKHPDYEITNVSLQGDFIE